MIMLLRCPLAQMTTIGSSRPGSLSRFRMTSRVGTCTEPWMDPSEIISEASRTSNRKGALVDRSSFSAAGSIEP